MADSYRGMECFSSKGGRKDELFQENYLYETIYIRFICDLNFFINYSKLSEIYLNRESWNLLIGNIFIYRIYFLEFVKYFRYYLKIKDNYK